MWSGWGGGGNGQKFYVCGFISKLTFWASIIEEHVNKLPKFLYQTIIVMVKIRLEKLIKMTRTEGEKQKFKTDILSSFSFQNSVFLFSFKLKYDLIRLKSEKW